MSDVNHGGLQALVQANQLIAGVDPQGRIQIGQGFVKQKHLGLAHNGPAQCHPLALAARQGKRLAVQQLVQAKNAAGFFDAGINLLLVHLAAFQAKAQVLGHRHVRVQGVRLEHHGNVAVFGGHLIDFAAINFQLTLGDGL